MHHPKADIDRICVKRKEKGNNLLQFGVTYKSRDDQYCGLFENKLQRMPVYKYC